MALSSLKTLRESGKRKVEEKLFIIPFLFTFLNAFFGLLSVINIFEGQFVLAASCILFACVMDFCDGRLARAFDSCSGLGMELDSLCDAISFCFAPAILMYGWRLHQFGLLGLLAVGIYLCAGLFRLAKFNALHMNQKPYFIGLPTTYAGSFIATMMLSSEWISHSYLSPLVSDIGLVVMLIILSLLMPSKLKFESFKKFRAQTLGSKLLVALSCGLILFCAGANYPVFFLSALAYIIGNLVTNVIMYLKID